MVSDSVACVPVAAARYRLPAVADFAFLIISESSPLVNTSGIQSEMEIVTSLARRVVWVFSELSLGHTLDRLPSQLAALHSIPSRLMQLHSDPTYPTVLGLIINDEEVFSLPRTLQRPPEVWERTELAAAPPPPSTSSVRFIFRYGLNVAELGFACLRNHTTVELFRSPGSAEFLDTETKAQLRQSNSGFYSPDPGRAGWVFEEREVTTGQTGRPESDYNFVPGTTVALSPPFSRSIFHSAQVLLSLVASASVGRFPWTRDIDILLLPTVARSELNWSMDLLQVVLNYVTERVGLSRRPLVYLNADVTRALSNGHGPLCFARRVVLGAMELSAPFFNSVLEAGLFRDYVHDHVGLRRGSRHVPNLSPNHALRVTVLYRPANRLVMNLEELLKCVERTGVADLPWLHSHVMQLDGLSFQDQVCM